MKILSVNAGSSSLKFQMYEMPEEKVLISGVFERIGIDNSFYTIKLNGEKIRKEATLTNHSNAVGFLTKELLENNVVESLSEIKGVGHRIVQGADKFDRTVVINDMVEDTISELSSLAPLHNPAAVVGIKEEEMRVRDHDKEELSFYSKATSDIEFLFPFGWGELWGIADRTDYDLTQHQNTSGEDMSYFDDERKEKYVPYVIAPSLGADRVTLAFLCRAYDEEEIGEGDVRTVMHFHPALAPVKIGVLPLSKKLNENAEKVFAELSKYYNCEYDDRGNIGKRYRRQDEIGTPYCVTYDFESEEDGMVTVRDRDTMQQERIKISELKEYFEGKFSF